MNSEECIGVSEEEDERVHAFQVPEIILEIYYEIDEHLSSMVEFFHGLQNALISDKLL